MFLNVDLVTTFLRAGFQVYLSLPLGSVHIGQGITTQFVGSCISFLHSLVFPG